MTLVTRAPHHRPRHGSVPKAGWMLVGLLLLAGSASACQICQPMPGSSLADRILSSEHLVLAREHPGEPYTLKPIRTLKGAPSDRPPLDLFLDSTTRRHLSADPHRSLLCAWSPEEKAWRRLAVHDESTAPVIAAIVESAGTWQEHPEARARYFAGLLGHDNTVLSDLAHIEVARLPYAKLLEFADRIPRDKLYAQLKNPRRMEWHALYIQFLGRSKEPQDHAFIREGLAHAARYGLAARTTAWAAALIEIDGRDAVNTLTELYLRNPDRRPEEIAAIQEALRIHGITAPPDSGDRLAAESPAKALPAP